MRESLQLVKKEAGSSIILTIEKVKCNEVDPQIGNEIIDSLTKTIKQIDSLIPAWVQLEKEGTKEERLNSAFGTIQLTTNTMTNLKLLQDLYDISTYSQFETGTFFLADSFSISPEKIDEAKKAIEPVAHRIVRFFADHPRQKFVAVIACSSIPAGQELNVNLRERRARSVANLLVEQIKSKKEFILNADRIRYHIKWVSQSEAIPYPGKRSSTVSIIWNLMPASFYAGSSDH
jgi:hypothetical protein